LRFRGGSSSVSHLQPQVVVVSSVPLSACGLPPAAPP
jgi:hypothetical protein